MIKKLFGILLFVVFLSLLMNSIVFANTKVTTQTTTEIETVYIGDEVFYLKTYISDVGTDQKEIGAAKGTITRTKTSNLENYAGQVMISVSITGTFTYNGISAVCTSCSCSSASYHPVWQITNYYSTRSGNSATNHTTAVQNNTYIYQKNVTITCSADGTVY